MPGSWTGNPRARMIRAAMGGSESAAWQSAMCVLVAPWAGPFVRLGVWALVAVFMRTAHAHAITGVHTGSLAQCAVTVALCTA